MEDQVALLAALAEPTRLGALCVLRDGGEHCVCELMRKLERAAKKWKLVFRTTRALHFETDQLFCF